MSVEVLVVAPNPDSPFIEADVAALRKHFSVERIAFDQFRNKADYLVRLYRRFRRGEVGVVLLWFLAPAYALETLALAHRFGRPVAVMTGGLDVDFVRALNLGGLKWPHNRLRQQLALRRVDLVLSMSPFSSEAIRRLASPRRLELVQMGVDVDHFTPLGSKERLALTVCFEITDVTARLKGLNTLVEAAARIPDVRFVIVGRPGVDGALERLRDASPPNVTFTGRSVSDDELLDLYRRAGTYVQVSAHEGFGLAAAEAMACECVPVVSAGHAIEDVVGNAGIVVPYGDSDATASAVEQALAAPELGHAARERVVRQFAFRDRIDKLAELLGPLAAA